MMSPAMGEGERAEARRRARSRGTIAASAVVAALIIAAAALSAQQQGRIAPAGAITITLLYTGALVWIGWRTCRKTDEVEVRDNLVALAAAGAFGWLVYPGWYFMWLAGLLPEPSHELLFVATVLVTMLVYLTRRIAG